MTFLLNQLGGGLSDLKMRNIDSAGLHEIIGEFAPLIGVATNDDNVADKKIKTEQEEYSEMTADSSKQTVKQEKIDATENSASIEPDAKKNVVGFGFALDLSVKPKMEPTELYPGEIEKPEVDFIPILPLKRELEDTSMIDQSVYKKSRHCLDSQRINPSTSVSPLTINETSSASAQNSNADSDEDGIKTSKLLYEIKTVSGLKYYQCKLCPKVYDTKYHLNRHLISHGGNRPHVCEKCGKSFAQKCDLNRHMNVHSYVRKHACSVCGKSFKRADYLAKHERQYCGVFKPHKCSKCHKGFEDAKLLEEHSCSQRIDGTQFSCENCDEKFDRVDDLVEHRKTHNTQVHEYQCSRCKEEFNSFLAYVEHFKRHSGERPYACDICQKIFTRNHNLMTHMWIHNQEKQHTCHMCAKTFTYYSNLQVHLRVHRNERPYKCLQCDKGFLTSSDLRRHQRVHSGEKPYQCEQCHAKYARKERLISHMITHMETGLENRDSLSEASKDSSSQEDDLRMYQMLPNGLNDTSIDVIGNDMSDSEMTKKKKFLVKMELPDSDFTAEYVVVKRESDSEDENENMDS